MIFSCVFRHHFFISCVKVHHPVSFGNSAHEGYYEHIFIVACTLVDAACLALVFTVCSQKWHYLGEAHLKGMLQLMWIRQIEMFSQHALGAIAGSDIVHQS